MEAVDREVLASSLAEVRHMRWCREVDEEDVVARGCGREDLRRGTGARSHDPGIGARKQRREPEVRRPQPNGACGEPAQLAHQDVAIVGKPMQWRIGDHVDAADVQQRKIEAHPGVSAPASLADRVGDACARHGDVDDVGLRIVGREQAGDRLLGPRRTDAHTGAVAEDQDRRAPRGQPSLEATSGLGETTCATDSTPKHGHLQHDAGERSRHQQQHGLFDVPQLRWRCHGGGPFGLCGTRDARRPGRRRSACRQSTGHGTAGASSG